MKELKATYRGRKVLVTGHTGFKGGWLCEWLLNLGAEVHGLALKPTTKPSLFDQLKLAKRIKTHAIGDIRDRAVVMRVIKRVRPDFIFHLAAQPLVRLSYQCPAETFDTNVMGTVNVLEAVRELSAVGRLPSSVNVVCITTDKVYENNDSGRPFREDDALGGYDPYSASKGACEVAIQSYRRAFFSANGSSVRIASARAGNVIGGGDWAVDRIVPDAMRAYFSDGPLIIRNHRSTRPWQHVLEPLYGYLLLGQWLADDAKRSSGLRFEKSDSLAFNFGPDPHNVKTVGALVKELQKSLRELRAKDETDRKAPHEAKLLTLDSHKAKRILRWRSVLGFAETIAAVADWYEQVVRAGADPQKVTRRQIDHFIKRIG